MKAPIATNVVGNSANLLEVCTQSGAVPTPQFNLGQQIHSPKYNCDYRITAVTILLTVTEQGQIDCDYYYRAENSILGQDDELELLQEEVYRCLGLRRPRGG